MIARVLSVSPISTRTHTDTGKGWHMRTGNGATMKTLPLLLTDKQIRDNAMLEEFKAWLEEDGYSPKVMKVPHPQGVTLGEDGLTTPTFSEDGEGYRQRLAYDERQAQIRENAEY